MSLKLSSHTLARRMNKIVLKSPSCCVWEGEFITLLLMIQEVQRKRKQDTITVALSYSQGALRNSEIEQDLSVKGLHCCRIFSLCSHASQTNPICLRIWWRIRGGRENLGACGSLTPQLCICQSYSLSAVHFSASDTAPHAPVYKMGIKPHTQSNLHRGFVV